MTYILNCVK